MIDLELNDNQVDEVFPGLNRSTMTKDIILPYDGKVYQLEEIFSDGYHFDHYYFTEIDATKENLTIAYSNAGYLIDNHRRSLSAI